jgi:hypothetical protein
LDVSIWYRLHLLNQEIWHEPVMNFVQEAWRQSPWVTGLIGLVLLLLFVVGPIGFEVFCVWAQAFGGCAYLFRVLPR